MLYDKHTNLQLRLYDQQAQGRIKCVYVSVYKRHVHVLLKDVSAMRWLRQVGPLGCQHQHLPTVCCLAVR